MGMDFDNLVKNLSYANFSLNKYTIPDHTNFSKKEFIGWLSEVSANNTSLQNGFHPFSEFPENETYILKKYGTAISVLEVEANNFPLFKYDNMGMLNNTKTILDVRTKDLEGYDQKIALAKSIADEVFNEPFKFISFMSDKLIKEDIPDFINQINKNYDKENEVLWVNTRWHTCDFKTEFGRYQQRLKWESKRPHY